MHFWKSGLVVLLTGLGPQSGAHASVPGVFTVDQSASATDSGLADAQRLFYSARYGAAAELAGQLQSKAIENQAVDLAISELRSSALHFQIKSALGNATDRDKALKACATCPALMKAFQAELDRSLATAHAALKTNPQDDEALFFVGKLNLNFVWLHLGTLGRRTGWDQYWEARKSLDTLLKRSPTHIRARVARAWIDYIVDTRMPRGTKWLLGGGSRRRALAAVREAAAAEADFFTHIEAEFALWDMLVREKTMTEATVVARRLARDFPDNPEVTSYLAAQH